MPGHYASFAYSDPFRSGFDAPLEGFRLPVEEEQEEEEQEEVDFSIPDDTNILEGLGEGLLGAGLGTFTIDYGIPTLGTVAGTPGIAGPVQFLTGAAETAGAAGAGASTLPFGFDPITASYLLYNLIPAIGNQISGQTDPLRKELSRLIAYKPGTGSFGKQQKGAIEFNTQLRDFAQALVDAGWDEDRGFVQQVQDGDPNLLSAFYDAASKYPSVVNYFVDRFGEGIFDRPTEDIQAAEQEEATVYGISGTQPFTYVAGEDPPDVTEDPTDVTVVDIVTGQTEDSRPEQQLPDSSYTEVDPTPDTLEDFVADEMPTEDLLEDFEDFEFEVDIPPPAVTQDTEETGGEQESSQQASTTTSTPLLTQQEIQDLIDEAVASAVSSATQGLLTSEQAQEQVALAVGNATSGLLTSEEAQEQASEAVEEALNNLPEDTTEFDQSDIDSAVSDALSAQEQEFAAETTGLESTIESLESSITGLEEEIAGSEQQISNLESNVSDLKSSLETSQQTASELQSSLETAQSALAEQQAVNTASQAQIESLSSSVSTLNGTVDNLTTKLAEVTQAKADAIEAGNQALADALEQAEETLQNTKDAAQETLQNAIAAGETKVTEAIAAGEAAVADAVAAGESAVANAVAAGEAAVAEAVAAGEEAAIAAEAAGREEGFGEGFGEGQGQGRGEGAGAGLGAGLGLGLGLGLLSPRGVTQSLFKDFKFTPTYQAPELQEAARQFETPNFLQGLFRDVA